VLKLSLSKTKRSFFDRKAVLDATSRAEHKVLGRFGAFVRRKAKGSIRKRKKISEPGKPPSSHTGVLKNFIFFAWDATKRAVVIGPTLANMLSFTRDRQPVNGTIPEALEYGGEVTILEEKLGDRWFRKDLRRRRGNRPTRFRTAKIAARPFMTPAFEAEAPKLPQMWKDAVK
jgi:hypothetical protein